jgi:type I restriction enzyme S subunit
MSSWEIKKLGDIARIYAGGTPSRKNINYWGGRIPWIKTTLIQNCIINKKDIDETITDLGLKSSSAKMAPKGAILMAMIGQGKTRGQVAILKADVAINQNCVAIILQNGIDSYYVWHQLLFRYKQIRNISNSSGQQNLNAEIIRGINLPFPEQRLQKKIGILLNHWDTAIEKTKALIVAKQKQFEWLATRLINQNHGQVYSLDELEKMSFITMGRGKVISKKDFEKNPGGYPVYSSSVKNGGLFGSYGDYMFNQELITWSVDGGGDFFYRNKH